ncbi:hypothetical protein ACFXPA_05715 [Amycolatopsis sp. NPDC059090]|uniref:hypothetical protein n=1 Tax=unclassified Amycolatopsis TaxID=2618356 RepID=UPI0036734FBD
MLAAAASAATVGPAQAAFPGDNGKIFFEQSGAILSMSPDGTGVAAVTSGQDSTLPRVSADGTKVAFERRVGPDVQVFTMNPDGTEVTQITSGAYADGQTLTWSPDGAELAFNDRGRLTVMNADGSAPVTLGIGGLDAAWSPDGARIAYSSSDGLISTVRPDGTGNTPLARIPGQTLHHPRWSPDGTRIAFSAFSFSAVTSDPQGAHVYTANADGTNPANISGTNNNDVFPVWSPDSALILFMVDTQGLLVMNADGTNRTRIFDNGTGMPPRPDDWAAVPEQSPRPPQPDNRRAVVNSGTALATAFTANSPRGPDSETVLPAQRGSPLAPTCRRPRTPSRILPSHPRLARHGKIRTSIAARNCREGPSRRTRHSGATRPDRPPNGSGVFADRCDTAGQKL